MDSEQDKPSSQQHASAPGVALAAAREAMGLSVEQIADQLKLASRQVLAIERGDFDALPNRAVTRGFIRAYAKAVRLDPAPLVAMVEVEGAAGHADATVRPTKVTASFQESRFPSLTERNSGKPLGAIVAGVAVLALAGGAAAWQMGLLNSLNLPSRVGVGVPASAPEAAPPVVVAQPSSQPAEAPIQSPNVPLISVPPQPGSNAQATVPGAGVAGEPAGGAAAAGAAPGAVAAPGVAASPAPVPAVVAPADRAGPTVGGAPSVATVSPAATPASPGLIPVKPANSAAPGAAAAKPGVAATAPPATAPAAAPAPAAPAAVAGQAPAVGNAGGKLVLNVKEDSWVEIRRAGQPKLIARMVRAGGTETFNVRADDVLIVGKPSAVSASLAGGKLELTQGPGKSYALVNIK
jgi:cytoskeleton protein RodZ